MLKKNVAAVDYKIMNQFNGDAGKYETALLLNIFYFGIAFVLSIVNFCILWRKPFFINFWAKCVAQYVNLFVIIAYLPPFMSYTGDYSGALLFPIVLYTVFGCTIQPKQLYLQRWSTQALMNVYIFWYLWVYEYKTGNLLMTSFMPTFCLCVFWDFILCEMIVRRNWNYEAKHLVMIRELLKMREIQQKYRDSTIDLLQAKMLKDK